MILFENPPTVYFEKVEDYEEKSTPWRRVPPTYKGSSTKNGRNKKQIISYLSTLNINLFHLIPNFSHFRFYTSFH